MVKMGKVIGLGSASRGFCLSLPRPSVAILLLLTVFHMEVVHGQSQRSTFQQPHTKSTFQQPDLLSELGQDLTETMEDLIGEDNFRIVISNLSSMVWIVSSGISSGLQVVVGILRQFLNSFGMDGNSATQFLKRSPSQVQTLLLWGLTALIAYWVISLLLSLILAILSRIMWALRTVLFMACFVFIVFGVNDRSTQVLLLLALLAFNALLGQLKGSQHAGAHLEDKVRRLESQVEELKQRQPQRP